MTEKLVEQLSALMDNEYTEHECALALRRLGKETELLACWERYHLVSDVLKGHMPDALSTGFSARMRALIEAEPPFDDTADAPSLANEIAATSPVAKSSFRPAWFKPVAGFAVAASVAGVALLGLQLGDTALPDSSPIAPEPPLLATTENSTENLAPSMPAREQDEMAEKLNAYLFNHNELATVNGINGVMPYVRMVNYQASR